jgi:hypothetical protein
MVNYEMGILVKKGGLILLVSIRNRYLSILNMSEQLVEVLNRHPDRQDLGEKESCP